jgi:hypothetical protein
MRFFALPNSSAFYDALADALKSHHGVGLIRLYTVLNVKGYSVGSKGTSITDRVNTIQSKSRLGDYLREQIESHAENDGNDVLVMLFEDDGYYENEGLSSSDGLGDESDGLNSDNEELDSYGEDSDSEGLNSESD